MAGEAKEILKFAALMATAPGLVQKETAKGINRAGFIVQRATQRGTPVRTGTLRRSWAVDKATAASQRAVMGTAVPYGPYVEFGTSRGMKPRRMLGNAIEATRGEVEQAYRDIPANVIRALKAGQR